jgi:predicted acyltransferase
MTPQPEFQPQIASPHAQTVSPAKPERLLSLDAYRGTIMLMMASAGFGLSQIAKNFPDSSVWKFIGYQTDHVPWTGCSLWDIIQPAFMFMVGVALPWSIANRRAQGQTFPVMLGHALWRGLALVLLAVFLTSNWSKRTAWDFTNVLAQIGWGYPLLFLLAFTKPCMQWAAAGGILFLYWLAFALYPLPPATFDWSTVGIATDWPHLSGFAAHWDKNYNLASNFDQWFLNLFTREKTWLFNSGGYHTLNFIPSLATMVFGLLAGQLLRSNTSLPQKLKRLALFGIAGLVIGQLLAICGVCPIVKRIWTPSWAIFSGGWAALLLAGFVAVIELWGCRRWAFPMVIVGLNPITLYCMWQLMSPFVRENLQRHISPNIFEWFGQTYTPMLQRGLVLLVLWLILLWMYRRKIFLRI